MDTFSAGFTIFVLALFVGFEVITKVPPILHTPLMSGSNAISGITLIGALISAGTQAHVLTSSPGVCRRRVCHHQRRGGFLVTHRMLKMFRQKE